MKKLIKFLNCSITKCRTCENRMKACQLIDGQCPTCRSKQA